MRTFFSIFVVFLSLLLAGCRASKESKVRSERTSTSEIGVEFHDLQRFWNSFAERLNFKIEFYPAMVDRGSTPVQPDNCVPIDPYADTGSSIVSSSGSSVGFGSVKSIEFSSERIAADSSFAQTDSVADFKSAEASDVHTEKASELRQDNGTWAIVSVVTAVVFFAFVWIIIRKFLKK